MGDDRSRKQTEESARIEARRRAAEQAATHVRSSSIVSMATLDEDITKIVASGKVKILEVINNSWDKDCYTYRIKAEVIALKPTEQISQALSNEEAQHWLAIDENPSLLALDNFIDRFPMSTYSKRALALQSDLENNYSRASGYHLVYRESILHMQPKASAISISTTAPGEILIVKAALDNDWAVIARDFGELYTRFANLRPISPEEAVEWKKCTKLNKDLSSWQKFYQNFPDSHLSRIAKIKINQLTNALHRDEGLSTADTEEIAFWNRCLKTSDSQCARDYRRRYPRGKFEKDSWRIR